MAYDEALAQRIRRALGLSAGITERKMFGGLSFLLDGRMFCGIAKNDLMVRIGPEQYREALRRPHVRPMDFTGRPMRGYVFVGPAGCHTAKAVAAWVESGVSYVSTLSTRAVKARTPRPRR